jgi:hypothetical protein
MMRNAERRRQTPRTREALDLMELAEKVLTARSIGGLAEQTLPDIAGLMNSSSAFLYLSGSWLPTPLFFHHGYEPRTADRLEMLCARQFDMVAGKGIRTEMGFIQLARGTCRGPTSFPLLDGNTCVGLIGVMSNRTLPPNLPELWQRAFRLLAGAIRRLAEDSKMRRRFTNLNTYLSVSSMLPQFMHLNELLEAALNCCMDEISAEAASVLLIDIEKKSFQFYQVEGPAKPLLTALSFPADRGIAGSVFQSMHSEIINDARKDPRFYGAIDTLSRFRTRNMIAVPLLQADEKIGVLEILNKSNGIDFIEEDLRLLLMIAEEISYAIRNARVLDYFMSSYCKQRQGQFSCKGCRRPLGSWTPCAKEHDLGSSCEGERHQLAK